MGDEDPDDDPFEKLGDESDREGDPFEHLAPSSDDVRRPDEEPTGHTAADADDTGTDGREQVDDHPFETFDDEFEEGFDDAPRVPDVDAEEGRDEAPSDPRRQAQDAFTSREARDTDEDAIFEDIEGIEDDPFESARGAFESVDVAEVDPDEVWERLHRAREDGSVAEPDERATRVVSKHQYCETCEFFSPPPDIECTHEGTDVVEFPDMDHVLVADCPVVAEREELEQLSE